VDDESLQARSYLTSFEREAQDIALLGIDRHMTATDAAVHAWEAARLYYTQTWLQDAYRTLRYAEEEFVHQTGMRWCDDWREHNIVPMQPIQATT